LSAIHLYKWDNAPVSIQCRTPVYSGVNSKDLAVHRITGGVIRKTKQRQLR